MAIYRGTTQDGAGVQATPAFSATQLGARTVWEKIKLNFAQNTKLIAMIADGEIDDSGITKKAGYISKWEVQSARFESFNYTPFPTSVKTVSLSGTTLTLDATVGSGTANLGAYYTLINTSNPAMMARIDSITSTTVCEITSVGDTAFNPAADDVLIVGPTAYPENSSAPTILSKDFDNVYNLLQIARQPVAISNSMLKSKFLAGGDYFKLLKEVNFIELLRKLERGFLFGSRAAGAVNTTTGGAAHADAFRTTRGVFNWAASTFDMKGNMTPYKFRTEIPKVLTTVKESQKVIALGGFDSCGRINEWLNAQALYTVNDAKSALREYGVNTNILRTLNMPIEVVRHEAFDVGELAKTMLLFVPDNLMFAHLKDRDIRPVVGIQNNDLDGMIDSVECEFGAATIDGGQSVCVVKNCW